MKSRSAQAAATATLVCGALHSFLKKIVASFEEGNQWEQYGAVSFFAIPAPSFVGLQGCHVQACGVLLTA